MMCSATDTLAVCYERQAVGCGLLETSKASETLLSALTSSMAPCCAPSPPAPKTSLTSSSTNTSDSDSEPHTDDEPNNIATSQLPRMCSMDDLVIKLQAQAMVAAASKQEAQISSGESHLVPHVIVTALISLALAHSLLL